MPNYSAPIPPSAGERTRRDFLRTIGCAFVAPLAGCVGRPGAAAAPSDYVVTVRGPIPAEELGFTLPHEHVFVTHRADPSRSMTDPEVAVRELTHYASAGGRSMVDMNNIGRQNPTALRLISERTGLNIVMGTGYFKHDRGGMPPETHDLSVEDMTAQFVRDIEIGVNNTGIRAGIIGEVGLSRPMTSTEERGLRAAAHAQRHTGVGINLHFDIGGGLPEHEAALDILAAEGADLRRVALSHFQPDPKQMAHFHRIAGRGCFVEFDLFGLHKCLKMRLLPEDRVMFDVIRRLVDEGLSSHLLLSQDIFAKACLVEYGGFGYAHILRTILPQLEAIGVERSAIRRMTVENPRRLLAVRAK
ncbi:MAG: phosphotriesterase family protein [Opitutaceae bacterium]